MNFKKIIKIFVIFAIFGLSFSSFLVLNHNMGKNNNGNMSSCILMVTNQPSCQMSISEHLLVWQTTFIAVIGSNFIYMLSLLSILLFVSFIKYIGTDPPPQFFRRYDKANRRLNIFNYFLRALSKGIVHAEIYA